MIQIKNDLDKVREKEVYRLLSSTNMFNFHKTPGNSNESISNDALLWDNSVCLSDSLI